MQKGTRKNTLHPNGQDYYTKLHQDIVKQTVNVTKVSTGIFENQANTPFYGIEKVWPNPVKGNILYIEYNAKISGNVSFELFNISGNRIRLFTRKVSPGNNRVEISLQGVPGGSYLLGCGEYVIEIIK